MRSAGASIVHRHLRQIETSQRHTKSTAASLGRRKLLRTMLKMSKAYQILSRHHRTHVSLVSHCGNSYFFFSFRFALLAVCPNWNVFVCKLNVSIKTRRKEENEFTCSQTMQSFFLLHKIFLIFFSLFLLFSFLTLWLWRGLANVGELGWHKFFLIGKTDSCTIGARHL